MDREREKMKGERMVIWERFLPHNHLRVLLVEGDDSTRQLVSALLRNCSYQVTAVGDGLLAWGLLEDPSNCFDLVLTEVDMTSLSGFNLLCKITSHKSLKHIPVIMMSSHDSMSMVFKCLTNGAVDFLVKPIRKNELQNLWQHVWRRCHSIVQLMSCNDQSSSGIRGRQNQNTAQRKIQVEYDSNAGDIGGRENAMHGLDIREGSDNGSDTQGSWTNQQEVEISHQRGKGKRLCSNGSRFDEAKHIKKETTQNKWIESMTTSVKACDDAKCQDLVIAIPGKVSTHVECLKEESSLDNQTCQNQEVDFLASCGECDRLGSEAVEEGNEPLTKAIDFIGNLGSEPYCSNGDQEDGRSREDKINTRVNCYHRKDKALTDYNSMLELELTLNRPQANWHEYIKLKDKFTLGQSDASIFSRCNSDGTRLSFPWGGSFPVNLYPKNREQDNTYSEKTGSLHLRVPFEQLGCSKRSGGDASDQYQLLQNTNNRDRGASVVCPSGQVAQPSSEPIKDETPVSLPMGVAMPIPSGIISFDGVPLLHGTSLSPMFYSCLGVPIWGLDTPLKAEREEVHDCVSSHVPDHSHLHNHLHHHHIQYHHHHHHHHHHEGYEHMTHARQDECPVDKSATFAQGGSCVTPRNTFSLNANCGESGSNNVHESNGNADRSASGSNNGINLRNEKITVAVIPGANGGSDTGNTITSTTYNGVENTRFACRAAALMKFRQKRKVRCIRKKVRYQSRNYFAEQRPRVKGQFVRHLSMNKI